MQSIISKSISSIKKICSELMLVAMNKVLHKKITKASEAKFARWQALFANFDFDIEHIKGSENSILDFLSRENLQASVKTSECVQESEGTSERGQANVVRKQEISNVRKPLSGHCY
jgi:hypothetical protein